MWRGPLQNVNARTEFFSFLIFFATTFFFFLIHLLTPFNRANCQTTETQECDVGLVYWCILVFQKEKWLAMWRVWGECYFRERERLLDWEVWKEGSCTDPWAVCARGYRLKMRQRDVHPGRNCECFWRKICKARLECLSLRGLRGCWIAGGGGRSPRDLREPAQHQAVDLIVF